MPYLRKDSINVSDAIQDIKHRTKRRQDSCARAFAKALIDNMPELEFWQFAPPDVEDRPETHLSLDRKLARQVWQTPIALNGHMIGHWLLDVYAGSASKIRHGNKWNEHHEFNYSANFKSGAVAINIENLPMPLMRHFRANSDAIRSICSRAKETLIPAKRRGASEYTRFVEMAAIQVADWAQSGTDADIRDAIDNLEDELMTAPIHEVRISTSDPSKIIVAFQAEEEGPIRQKRLALSTFISKVQGVFASSR